jgi:hypothetical protein
MLLVVPYSCQFHTFFKSDFGRVAQFGFGPANVIYATIRKKLDTTAREWSMLTFHAWYYGKDI